MKHLLALLLLFVHAGFAQAAPNRVCDYTEGSTTIAEGFANCSEEVAELYKRGVVNVSITGTNSLTGTSIPALTAYTTGLVIGFTTTGSNTGAMTINVDTVGSVALQSRSGAALVSGDVPAASYLARYDGTAFRIVTQTGTVINVLDYGAKGDAVTDDTAAISAALDAGLTVYFPPRRYVIAGNIPKLRDGHVLYGPDGSTSGTTSGDVGGAKFLITTMSGAVFSDKPPTPPTPRDSLDGLNISNITMNVSGTPSWVIDLPTVSGLNLNNVAISVDNNSTATGCLRTQKIDPMDSSWTASLIKFRCRVPDAATVYSVDTDVSDSELIGGAYIGGLGVRLRGTGNVKAIGNKFDRSSADGAGLTIAKATNSKTAHLIVGNQFDANSAKGLLIDGDFDDTLSNTDVRPAITGNQFRTLGTGTFDIFFKNTTGAVLTGVPISGNTHASPSAAQYSFDPTRWTGIDLFPIQFIALSANYTLSSVITEQKLFNSTANGRLTLQTGTYGIECELAISAMSATSGNAAFDILGAGTATIGQVLYQVVGIDQTTLNATGARSGTVNTTAQTQASMVTAGTGTSMAAEITGTFRVTAAGSIQPSVTLVTAAAAVVTAPSYCKFTRIGSSTVTNVGQWD